MQSVSTILGVLVANKVVWVREEALEPIGYIWPQGTGSQTGDLFHG